MNSKRISNKLLKIGLDMSFTLCFQQVIQCGSHFVGAHVFNSLIKFFRAVNHKFLFMDCLDCFF